jgi:protein gp37
MTASKIEWTDFTWNPVRGCSRVSPGCGGANHEGGCYAEKMAARFSDPGQPYHGFAKRTKYGGAWTGKLALIPEMLTLPLHWRKPRRIFVDSMADLFAEGVEDEWIDRAFAVMALCPQHTFQVLTKRPERMRDYIGSRAGFMALNDVIAEILHQRRDVDIRAISFDYPTWPLPNVWLGTSVEDQQRADERIPHLLATPAAVRFLSCEPLLGPVDLQWAVSRNVLDIGAGFLVRGHFAPGLETIRRLDLIIIGGESGPRSRPCWTPDIRSLVRQCQRAGVAVFVKQLGANVRDRNDAGFEGCEPHEWPDMDPSDIEHDLDGTLDGYQGAPVRVRLRDKKGGTMDEWPADLRVREMPAATQSAARVETVEATDA